MTREELLKSKPGDFVYSYHDTGAMGVSPVIWQVVRANRKTITVRSESGETCRLPLQRFAGYWTEPGQYGVLTVKPSMRVFEN